MLILPRRSRFALVRCFSSYESASAAERDDVFVRGTPTAATTFRRVDSHHQHLDSA